MYKKSRICSNLEYLVRMKTILNLYQFKKKNLKTMRNTKKTHNKKVISFKFRINAFT